LNSAHRRHRAPAWRSTTSSPWPPDALTALGGYPGDEDKARELFPKLDQAKIREDFIAATHYARNAARQHREDRRRGLLLRAAGVVNMLATKVPELLAGVPFYGGAPPDADVKNIRRPCSYQHGGNDKRLVERLARLRSRRSRRAT
jgi:carboxymethylenebutenolidase